jgi:hypothetical protein
MSFRLKSGPNGPSILTSHLDAIALINDKMLYQIFVTLANKLGNFNLINHLKLIYDNCQINGLKHNDLRNGKISLASEPAAKTRLFAIGNF